MSEETTDRQAAYMSFHTGFSSTCKKLGMRLDDATVKKYFQKATEHFNGLTVDDENYMALGQLAATGISGTPECWKNREEEAVASLFAKYREEITSDSGAKTKLFGDEPEQPEADEPPESYTMNHNAALRESLSETSVRDLSVIDPTKLEDSTEDEEDK